MRATGAPKRKIARDLGIARNTVDAILDGSPVERPDYTALIHSKLIPKAIARIEQVLDNDTDTARWALERTVFSSSTSEPVVVDRSFNVAVGFVPTSTTSTPSLPSTTMSTGTEAPAKAGGDEIGLSLRTNFSQFSLAELEQHQAALAAELARRRSEVIDVQPEATDATAR